MPLENLRDFQKQIQNTGKLTGREAYLASTRSVFGDRFGIRYGAADTVEVGTPPPEGFGKEFTWDRADNSILLALFINAADPLGVSISGVTKWDTIAVTSCAGIASFTEDTGNSSASSIVGLLAKGADTASVLTGHPELVPLINAAESFAQDQFKPTHAKHMRRDAFGVDPGTGLKARAEGGIIISLPEAQGPYYSGDRDHKDRWIKEPGDRVDANRPSHVNGAFFPLHGMPSHNVRACLEGGQIYVTPWDWMFEDNAGYYRVFMVLSKGTTPGAVIEQIPLS